MKSATTIAAVITIIYCSACGTGTSVETSSGPPESPKPATLAQPTDATRLKARESLQTRIVGRSGRNRQLAETARLAAPVAPAQPMNPNAPSSGRVARTGYVKAPKPGQVFDVALAGSSFAATTEGGGLDVSFDPNVLEVVKVSVDATVWEFFSDAGAIDNDLGKITNLAFASFAGHSGDFAIATLTFRAKNGGDGKLAVSESPLNPFAGRGQRIRVDLQ